MTESTVSTRPIASDIAAHVRVLVALVRPAVVVLLALFAVTGLAQGGVHDAPLPMVGTLVVVIAFLLFAVTINDLSDEAIDRVNLSGDASRPLVTGASTHATFVLIAIAAAAIAVTTAALLHPAAAAVVAGGLALATAYSVRPVRIADRGAVASLLLPAGYVAVPYLVGVLAARGTIIAADAALLGGLYLGFIGRILLKDFRDVRGDALFGKRTFLVRHGRARTSAVSAACWIAGTSTLLGVRQLDVGFASLHVALTVVAVVLLRALAVDRGPRRDEALIAAIALVGRGMVISLVAHLGMTDAGWPAAARVATLLAIAVVVIGATISMVRRGPRAHATMPAAWTSVCAMQQPGNRVDASHEPEGSAVQRSFARGT